MYNQLTEPQSFGELKSKVGNVLKDVITAYRAGTLTTREELLESYSAALNELSIAVGSSLFVHEAVEPDTAPILQHRNTEMTEIQRDLVLLFEEMKRLGTLMVGLFDQIASEQDDLLGRVRRTSSKLSDYQLYNGTAGVLVTEGFVDSAGLDVGNALVSGSQCDVNYNEGAVTLSVNSKDAVQVKKITVDQQTFTGVVGSNEDLAADGVHATMSDITDGNPDSWTEFEKTYFLDEEKPFDLEMTLILELNSPTIINHIEIDPVNFGLLNGVIIQDIMVSLNGTDWVSIRDDLPLAIYNGETRDDVFLLSPASSKYSGVFSYTFLPRNTKYISVTLTQDTPYIINTNAGDKYRLAIGLSGIDVYSTKFAPKSELISTVRDVTGIIRKLALLTAYMPDETSNLASVIFSVSTDDGQNWTEIQPLTEDDWEQEEIVNVDGDYTSMRFKISMARNNEAFSIASSVTEDEEIVERLDVVTVNANASPQQVTPSQPLANTNVTVVHTPFGSRGDYWSNRPKFKIGVGVGDEIMFRLPFALYPGSNIHPEDLRVYVGGVVWELTYDLTDVSVGADDRVYSIDNEGFLRFGDGDGVNGQGLSPAAGADIEIQLEPEDISFYRLGDFYVATLDLPTDGSKSNTLLEHCLPPSSYASTILKPAGDYTVYSSGGNTVVRHHLSKKFITSLEITEKDTSGVTPGSPVFDTEVSSVQAVISGGSGSYYVDARAGVVYSFEFSNTYTVTARYKYIEHVNQPEFTLEKAGSEYQAIYIPIDSLVTHQHVDVTGSNRDPWGFFDNYEGVYPPLPVVTGNAMNLSHDSIIKGTLSFESGILGSSITPSEVDYIDGSTELNNILDAYKEDVAATSTVGNWSFTIDAGGNGVPEAGITFSDTDVFIQEDATLAVDGDWTINWSTGVVTVRLAGGIPSGVTMSYAYNEGSTSDLGRYSVDYKNGKVYCRTTPVSSKQVSYEFTKYRVSYNIGMVLDTELIDINVDKNLVSVETGSLTANLIHVIFEYIKEPDTSLSELTEYFTPVVRDISFRVLLDSMVI